MEIRKATTADDLTLARHYLAIWESYGTPHEQLRPDAEAVVINFIGTARQQMGFCGFVALKNGNPVGSAACQLHASPFPEVILPAFHRRGYIWSVYVDPACRGQGIAKGLTQHALDHLRSLGRTMAVLHASAAGQRLYEQLGFRLATEMRLDL